MSKIFRPRNLALMIVLLVIAALSFGFAASITVTSPAIGEGSDTFADFFADVDWQLNAADPTTSPTACADFFSDAGLTTALAVNDVRMAVLDGGGAVIATDGWVTCTVPGAGVCAGYDAQCPFTEDVANIYGVQIVAGQ